MDKDKLKKVRDKLNKRLGDEEKNEVNIVVHEPEASQELKELTQGFNSKLTEANIALSEMARLLRIANVDNKDLTIQESEKQNKILCDIGVLLTEVNKNTSKEIKVLPDRTDEVVSAIKENKPLQIDKIKVDGLEKALAKIAPSKSENPISATMEIEQDLWKSVTVKYPSSTLKVGIERTPNKVIKRITFN